MTFHATFIPAGRAAPCSRRRDSTIVFGLASLPWYPAVITQSVNRADVETPALGVERIHSPAKPLPLVRGRASERVPGPTPCARTPDAPKGDGAGRTALTGLPRRTVPRAVARHARSRAPVSARCSFGAPARRRTRVRRRGSRGPHPRSRASHHLRAMHAFHQSCDFRIQQPLTGVNARRPFARVRPVWAHYRPAIPMVL